MKCGVLKARMLLILVGSLSSPAFAISVNPSCGSTDIHRDLIQKIHISGPDNRVQVLKDFAQLGMSAEEARESSEAMGQCICPVSGGNQVETCSLLQYNDRVTTNIHLFRKNGDGPFLPPRSLEQCRFESFGMPKQIRKLVVKRGKFMFATEDIVRNPNLDMAVVMLDRPLAKVKPIPLVKSFTKLKKDDMVYNLSGIQEKLPFKYEGGAIGQVCQVLGNKRALTAGGPSVVTTCDSKHGASAGLLLVRVNGSLQAVGMTVLAPFEDKYDGQEASVETGLYTEHLYFSNELIQAVSDLKPVQGGPVITPASESSTPTFPVPAPNTDPI